MQRKYEFIVELLFCFFLFIVCFLNIYKGFHVSGDAYGYFRGAMSYYENGYYSNWGANNSVNIKNPFGYSLFLSYFMSLLGVKHALSFMTILNSILYSLTCYLLYKNLKNNIKSDSKLLISILLTLSIVLNSEFIFSFFSLYSEVIFLPAFILFLVLVETKNNNFFILLIGLVLTSVRWVGVVFVLSYLLLLIYELIYEKRDGRISRLKNLCYCIVACLLYFLCLILVASQRSIGEHALTSIVYYRFQDNLLFSFLDSVQRYILPVYFGANDAIYLFLTSAIALISICYLLIRLKLIKTYYFIVSIFYISFICFVHFFIDSEVTFRNRIFMLLVIIFAFILSKKIVNNFYTKLLLLYLALIVFFRLTNLYSTTISNFKDERMFSYKAYENSKILENALAKFDRFSLVTNDRAPYFFLYPHRLLRVDSKHLEQIDYLNEYFSSNDNELHMLYFHKDLKIDHNDKSTPISIGILSDVFNFDYEIVDEEPYLALLKIKRAVSI